MIEQRDREDFETAARNFRSHLDALAARLMGAGLTAAAGPVLVLERQVYYGANGISLALMSVLPAAPAESDEPERRPRAGNRQRAPKGQGSHRHKFGPDGKCACGAERQRAPKGSGRAAAPVDRAPGVLPGTGLPAGYRAPMPADEADDPFADGNMGSSGVVRR